MGGRVVKQDLEIFGQNGGTTPPPLYSKVREITTFITQQQFMQILKLI